MYFIISFEFYNRFVAIYIITQTHSHTHAEIYGKKTEKKRKTCCCIFIKQFYNTHFLFSLCKTGWACLYISMYRWAQQHQQKRKQIQTYNNKRRRESSNKCWQWFHVFECIQLIFNAHWNTNHTYVPLMLGCIVGKKSFYRWKQCDF